MLCWLTCGSYHLHHPERGSTDTARLLAMACDNPTGDLPIWLATHQGQTVDIDATCRGSTHHRARHHHRRHTVGVRRRSQLTAHGVAGEAVKHAHRPTALHPAYLAARAHWRRVATHCARCGVQLDKTIGSRSPRAIQTGHIVGRHEARKLGGATRRSTRCPTRSPNAGRNCAQAPATATACEYADACDQPVGGRIAKPARRSQGVVRSLTMLARTRPGGSRHARSVRA